MSERRIKTFSYTGFFFPHARYMCSKCFAEAKCVIGRILKHIANNADGEQSATATAQDDSTVRCSSSSTSTIANIADGEQSTTATAKDDSTVRCDSSTPAPSLSVVQVQPPPPPKIPAVPGMPPLGLGTAMTHEAIEIFHANCRKSPTDNQPWTHSTWECMCIRCKKCKPHGSNPCTEKQPGGQARIKIGA